MTMERSAHYLPTMEKVQVQAEAKTEAEAEERTDVAREEEEAPETGTEEDNGSTGAIRAAAFATQRPQRQKPSLFGFYDELRISPTASFRPARPARGGRFEHDGGSGGGEGGRGMHMVSDPVLLGRSGERGESGSENRSVTLCHVPVFTRYTDPEDDGPDVGDPNEGYNDDDYDLDDADDDYHDPDQYKYDDDEVEEEEAEGDDEYDEEAWRDGYNKPNGAMSLWRDGYDSASGALLAVHHFNNGVGTVVKELDGIDERCDVRFTTEVIDTRSSPDASLRHLLGEILTGRDAASASDFRYSPPACAVVGEAKAMWAGGAGEDDDVTRAMSKMTDVYDVLQVSPWVSDVALSPVRHDIDEYDSEEFARSWKEMQSDEEVMGYINSKQPPPPIDETYQESGDNLYFYDIDHYPYRPPIHARYSYDAVVAMGLAACRAASSSSKSTARRDDDDDGNDDTYFTGTQHRDALLDLPPFDGASTFIGGGRAKYRASVDPSSSWYLLRDETVARLGDYHDSHADEIVYDVSSSSSSSPSLDEGSSVAPRQGRHVSDPPFPHPPSGVVGEGRTSPPSYRPPSPPASAAAATKAAQLLLRRSSSPSSYADGVATGGTLSLVAMSALAFVALFKFVSSAKKRRRKERRAEAEKEKKKTPPPPPSFWYTLFAGKVLMSSSKVLPMMTTMTGPAADDIDHLDDDSLIDAVAVSSAHRRQSVIACMVPIWLLVIGYTISMTALFGHSLFVNRHRRRQQEGRATKTSSTKEGRNEDVPLSQQQTRQLKYFFLSLFCSNVLILAQWTWFSPLLLRKQRQQGDGHAASPQSSEGDDRCYRCHHDGGWMWAAYVIALAFVNLMALFVTAAEKYGARRNSASSSSKTDDDDADNFSVRSHGPRATTSTTVAAVSSERDTTGATTTIEAGAPTVESDSLRQDLIRADMRIAQLELEVERLKQKKKERRSRSESKNGGGGGGESVPLLRSCGGGCDQRPTTTDDIAVSCAV